MAKTICTICQKEVEKLDINFCCCRECLDEYERQANITNGDKGKFIYVIQAKEFYKIGIADDIKDRVATLQTSNPHRLRVVLCQRHRGAEHTEQYLHKYFDKKRRAGEWFKLSDEDVEWIAWFLVRFIINNPRT